MPNLSRLLEDAGIQPRRPAVPNPELINRIRLLLALLEMQRVGPIGPIWCDRIETCRGPFVAFGTFEAQPITWEQTARLVAGFEGKEPIAVVIRKKVATVVIQRKAARA